MRVLLASSLIAAGMYSSRAAAPATPLGFAKVKEFLNIGGVAVGDLTGNPRFPNSPDVVGYPTYLEWPQTGDINTAPPGDVKNNYGVLIQGYFYPTETRAHLFTIAADDGAQFWLSTDDDPSKKVLLCREPEWNGVRNFNGTERRPNNEHKSAEINLVKGKAYYFEALMKEGGGGDNLAVSIDDTLPIPGSQLSPFDVAATAKILTQPTDAFVYAGSTASFSVAADVPPPATVTSIKWQKNGTDIPDSNNGNLRFAAALADNGAKYKAIITTSTGTLTSSEATLTVATFSNEFASGVVKFEAYHDITGTAVQGLLDAEKFPASPDNVQLLTAINSPDGYGENYGARVTGFIIPPKSGSYRFFIRSDDASQFYLNTTAGGPAPVPGTDTPIAEETGCCNGFTEPDSPRTSEPVTLNAGSRYAFVALVKEGGGGDFLQVAVREEGSTTAAGSLQPISGAWIGANAKPNLGTPVITQQPVGNPQLVEGRNATLKLAAVVNPTQYGFPAIIQWRKNGTAIPGATGSSLAIRKATAADSGTYSAVVSAPSGQSVTSADAVVTVVPDTFPPLPTAGSIRKGGKTEVSVTFDEAVDAATAGARANYSISGGTIDGVVGITRSIDGFVPEVISYTGAILTVSGLTAGTSYEVTVNGVKDLKGNTTANAKTSFKATGTFNWAALGANENAFQEQALGVGDNGFDLISGGSADWNTYNEATFAYEEITGDFDKVAQMVYQDPTSQWARAGLSARESLDAGIARDGAPFGRHQSVHVPHPQQWNGTGSNRIYEGNRRLDAGGATDSLPGGPAPQDFPDRWLRIKREGNTIRIFNSDDGKTWREQGSGTVFTNGNDAEGNPRKPLPAKMFVGPFYAPEYGNNGTKDGLGHSALVQFRNYGNFQVGGGGGKAVASVSRKDGKAVITFEGVLQSADKPEGPFTDTNATSPFTPAGDKGAQFFRARSN